uniref:Uncharacterized protein n=1 Tax=Macaca fascicularis TaxID=9541 RepID=A0A7N9CPQ7_MACFA
MAAAAYVDHFAAECLVSMSSRAVVTPAACRRPPRARLPGGEGAAAAPQPGVERAGARGGAGTRAGAGTRGERRARPQTKGPAGPKSRRPRVPAEEAQVPLRGLRESLREILAPQGAPENSHRSVGRRGRPDCSVGVSVSCPTTPRSRRRARGRGRAGRDARGFALPRRSNPLLAPRAVRGGSWLLEPAPARRPRPAGHAPPRARSGGAAGADVVIWVGAGTPRRPGGGVGRCGQPGCGPQAALVTVGRPVAGAGDALRGPS